MGKKAKKQTPPKMHKTKGYGKLERPDQSSPGYERAKKKVFGL